MPEIGQTDSDLYWLIWVGGRGLPSYWFKMHGLHRPSVVKAAMNEWQLRVPYKERNGRQVAYEVVVGPVSQGKVEEAQRILKEELQRAVQAPENLPH
jgi:hypothetical protein